MPSYDKARKKWRGVVKKDGKRYQQTFATKAEAKKWEVKQAEEIERLASSTPDSFLQVKVAEYLSQCELSDGKVVVHVKRQALSRLLKHVGLEALVSDVTPEKIRTHLVKQAKARTGGAANDDRKKLATFFTWIEAEDDNFTSPMRHAPKFKSEVRDKYCATQEEVDALLALAEPEFRLYLQIMCLTGGRVHEVNELAWDRVDFERNRLGFISAKTGKNRPEVQWVNIGDWLAREIKRFRMKADPKNVYVFTNPETGNRYLRRDWKLTVLCEQAKTRRLSFHSFRRYFGTRMAMLGIPMKEIQAAMRHNKLSTTEIYINKDGTNTRGAVETLEAVLAGKSTPKKSGGIRSTHDGTHRDFSTTQSTVIAGNN